MNMASKIELTCRCTHCGKKNLYKTKRKEKKIRQCGWCGGDFEVIPIAQTVSHKAVEGVDLLTRHGSLPSPPPKLTNKKSFESPARIQMTDQSSTHSGEADFDPYLEWLGIRTLDRPPNHYRLLGLEIFETDIDVITSAADRQLAHVRSFQSGQHGVACAELLRELLVARNCLRVETSRITYERSLRTDLSHQARLTADVTANSDATFHSGSHTHFNQQGFLPQGVESIRPESNQATLMEDNFQLRKTVGRKRTRHRKRKKKSAISELMGTVVGGITGVLICYLIFRWFISIEPETIEIYQENLRKIIE